MSRVQNRPDGNGQETAPDTSSGIVPANRIITSLLLAILICDSFATGEAISGSMENELFHQ